MSKTRKIIKALGYLVFLGSGIGLGHLIKKEKETDYSKTIRDVYSQKEKQYQTRYKNLEQEFKKYKKEVDELNKSKNEEIKKAYPNCSQLIT